MKIIIVSIFFLIYFIHFTTSAIATPFPVKGDVFNGQNELVASAHVYPRYVEIFTLDNQMIGKVGIMVEEGIAKLFLVKQNDQRTLIGYSGPGQDSNQGALYDMQDKIAGYYYWTPTWSFIYNVKNKRVGKVKCIAWPRVCAAGVGGYLLNLFNQSALMQTQ